MKLRIIDEFWAVGKKTRRVGKMLKPLCAGRIEGQHGCFWMLSDVREDSAHVAYHRADGTLIREWDLKKGEKKTQDLTDKYCKEIDSIFEKKQKEIMEI